MIGIVLVSHSYALAEGARELCLTMSGPELKIAAAGGLDLPEHTTGTDPMRIYRGIEEVYSEDGVLIFVDMGSALLSADFAIQLCDEERQGKIHVSDAPFIEGAVTAAVQARMNASMEQILEELKGAMLPKQEQLGTAEAERIEADLSCGPEKMPELTLAFEIRNTYGLHARPAARIVSLAGQYPGLELYLKKEASSRAPVSGKSLNSITLLGVRRGDRVHFSLGGKNAAEAAEALKQLASEGFGDGAAEAAREPAAAAEISSREEPETEETELPREIQGLKASPGLAFGPAFYLQRDDRFEENPLASEASAEEEKFRQARLQVEEALQRDMQALLAAKGKEAAAIFEAHLLILSDPAIEEAVLKALKEQKKSAAGAWDEVMRQLEARYEASDSAYIRERAADIRELRRRLLTVLRGGAAESELSRRGILLADELSPGDVSGLDRENVVGFCTAKGSPSSHAAVIARSLGIPALMGMGSEILRIEAGTDMILDAARGRLLLKPDAGLVREMREQEAEALREEALAEKERFLPAVGAGGRRIDVFANIGSAEDAKIAVAKGAEGVGLLRTEFIYLNRDEAPSEEEQYEIYREIAQVLDGRPLTVRSLDAGGDKELPYLRLPREDNPFLGFRAIRICLEQRDLFRTQLRAILRAAREYPLRLMFPMISSEAEFRAAKAELRLAGEELLARGISLPEKLPTGMMIEIPSAAILADKFAREADFFSIGTNDLTQYTLAAERGNQKLAKLYSPSHPAVLELIRRTVAGARSAGIPVAVCGEFAADPEGAKKLIELGVDELSVNPPAIPVLKRRIRSQS